MPFFSYDDAAGMNRNLRTFEAAKNQESIS